MDPVGILLSYWGGLFSGAMLVSGRVTLQTNSSEVFPTPQTNPPILKTESYSDSHTGHLWTSKFPYQNPDPPIWPTKHPPQAQNNDTWSTSLGGIESNAWNHAQVKDLRVLYHGIWWGIDPTHKKTMSFQNITIYSWEGNMKITCCTDLLNP